MKNYSFLGMAFVLLFSCHFRPAATGIYYWKTSLDWSDSDTRRLRSAGVDRVGLRLFDWGVKGAEGPLAVRAPLPASMEVVPVVYVTLERLQTWAKEPGFDASGEAATLLAKMDQGLALAWPGRPAVYQLDADWTASTRDAWFAVVSAFRERVHSQGAQLEVTVRLHQYRDRRDQGVPPADSGILLLYGLGDAVIDGGVVDAYVHAADYPLPLVLALPDYTQVRQLNGYGRLVALHRLGWATELPMADLRAQGSDRYEVIRRSSLGGRPLLAHDQLLVDRVGPDVLAAVATLPAVAAIRKRSGDRIWVFDYDSSGWEALVHGPLAPYLFPR